MMGNLNMGGGQARRDKSESGMRVRGVVNEHHIVTLGREITKNIKR